MPTKILFSGSDHPVYRKILDKRKVRNRTVSFRHLFRKSKQEQERIIKETFPEDACWLIECGADLFIKHWLARRQLSKKGVLAELERTLSDYFEKYSDFLVRCQDYVFAATEADLYDVVEEHKSVGTIEGMQEGAYRREDLPDGIDFMACWHPEMGDKKWFEILERSRYVGMRIDDETLDNKLTPYFKEAQKRGVYVHGFNMVRPEILRRHPFYTLDIATWLNGAKFGTLFTFQAGKINWHNKKSAPDVMKVNRKRFQKAGIDTKKLEAGDYQTLVEANLVAWLLFAEYYRNHIDLDYWSTELNGNSADDEKEVASEPSPFPILEEKKGIGLPEKNEKRESGGSASVSDRDPLVCNNCHLSDRCPYVQLDASCYFGMENKFETRADIESAMKAILKIQLQRVKIGSVAESLDGGILNPKLSNEIERFVTALERFSKLGTLDDDENDDNKEKKAGGLLAGLLSGLSGTEQQDDTDEQQDGFV